jgi:two-component system, OmpR family, sensor histidine kinase QseC
VRAIFRPSLSRRIFVAILIAFAIVLAVLFSYAFLEAFLPNKGLADVGRKNFVEAVGKTLVESGDSEQIRTAARMTDRIIQTQLAQQNARSIPRILVWDSAGNRIYAAPELADALLVARSPGLSDVTANGLPYRAATMESNGYIVEVIDSVDATRADFVSAVIKDLLINLAIALPFVLIPAWLAVRGGLRPLRELSASLLRRHPNDLTAVEAPTPYAEMAPLVDALNELLAQLRKKIAREQAFVHDAAHELQTPLAVIANQIHVLASAELAAARTDAKQSAERAVQRASHLVRQLLELARVDAGPATGDEEINIAAVAREVLARAVPVATAKAVEVSLLAPDTLLLRVNAHALYSIIGNLVDNAVRYVGKGGHVAVELDAHPAGISLRVLDDGPGIAEADRERVFDRFYRVAGSDEAGSGLGLAIVRQAVASMAGIITLGPGLEGRGCCFTVEVPIPPTLPRMEPYHHG